MVALMILALLTAVLLGCVDAHGYSHPGIHTQDRSFDNIVEQKYDTLESLDPTFVAAHRRKLAKDFTDDRNEKSFTCDPKCYFDNSPKGKGWMSCDDLVKSRYTCSELDANHCKGKCDNCICSCEKNCDGPSGRGLSCEQWLELNPALTCAELENRTTYGCNCRGCSKCEDGCTQKCSMRDTNIKGSHECGIWYRMDPKYTTKFLKAKAVVTGTDDACTCAGCNGNKALDFCPNDFPDENSNYMDIETAKAKGKIGKMRLAINDDMLDPEKCKKNKFCEKHTCLEGDAGKKTINNCEFERGPEEKNKHSKCEVKCTKEDILTKEKSFMVRRRFGWLKTFMGNLLSLKPTKDAIKLNAEKVHFIKGLNNQEGSYTADLVVVVTMRPTNPSNIAGYAITYQRDTERRSTVGLFNWAPRIVDDSLYKIEKDEETLSNAEKAGLLYAKAADYRLMVHEVLHLTGAIQSDPNYFINKAGKIPCSHQIYVDEVEEWSGHRVRKIRTPKLLARAREQFACSSLTGVPMEDHHIGKNAHWEARVFGSEIMSYGDNSGESYLSDLTLAFLEDTGYYVVNYTVGGRLTPHSADKIKLANMPTLLQKDKNELIKQVGEAGNTSAKTTPGYTRWGRHAGCEFVTGAPKNWPAVYRCDSPQSGGCTPDNKMTARCSLETWGQTAMTASTIRCEPPAAEPWGGAKTSKSNWECIKNPGGGLPEEYRHLGPQTTLAGYNDAMDFVPHFVGFWNCQDIRQKRLSPLDVSSEAGSAQNTSAGWEDLFGAMAQDKSAIGGQTQCENCRCFRSSLMPLSSIQNFSPKFPNYGLCYVSNCYNEEYLQVGIKGVRGLYWYGCPPEGGKMYVPSFIGSLKCPVAKEFCSVEPVSGVIYTETDANLEWIAYGVIGGIALILVIILCAFWKKIDHKVHFCCGIDQDHKDWDKVMEKRHGKHSASAYCLTFFGIIWAIAGSALLFFGVWSFLLPFVEDGSKPLWDTQTRQAPLMLAIGIFTLATSICAIEGAWKNKPTITLIAYFYVCVCTLVLCALLPFFPFILSEPLELILASQWVKYKNNFADSWQDFNSTEAMDHLVKVALPEYALYFAIAATVFIVSVIIGIVCSILQLTLHVVVRNFEVVMNMLFFVLGGLLIYFAVNNFLILDVYIYVSAIIPASFIFLVGLVGVLAACQKHETCFKIWAVVAAVGFVVTLVTASCLVYVSISPVKDAVSGRSPSTCVLPDKSSVVCKEPKPMCCSCVLAVDQVDIQLGTGTTASAATTNTKAVKTFTGCEHSCFDVPGYACTEVGINVTKTAAAPGDKPLLMQIEPYIRSLDDDKISEISTSMSESLDIVDFNVEQLVAWITAYVRIYAVVLYVCCLVICGLFATNRLIIHWNHQNDFPHGEHPYYLMFAVSMKKDRLRKKLHAASLLRSLNRHKFKGMNRRTPLLKSISRAAIQTREMFRPKKNITPITEYEIFRDPDLGLGMSMVATTYGRNNEHHCLKVNAFRYRPDGSPGPAEEVGVQLGDRVLTANGHTITDFRSLQRAVGNSNSVTMEFERDTTLTTIGEESGPANYDDHYPEIVMLHVRRASPATKMSAKLAEVHAHGHSSYYEDDDETSHVVVQDVWDGPLYQGGLLVNDVVLTIDDYNVETLQQVASLVQGKTEMDFVVKRMSQSQHEDNHRENKVQIFNVTISAELGLGLNLQEIKSGLGDSSSNTFLYVKELREYPDFAPGPGLIAGVRQYDLVLRINDMAVHTINDARRAIEGQKTAKCEVRRMIRHFSAGHPYHPEQHAEAKEVNLVVTRNAGESLGLALSESYGTDSDDPFLYVTKVREYSPGERAGIRVQDIIWQAEGQDVYSLDDLKNTIARLEKFELTVRRQS